MKALENQLKNSVSPIDLNHLLFLAKKAYHSGLERAKFIQQKKLRILAFVNDNGIDQDKIIINLSDRILSDIEKTALSKGLKFVIYNRNIYFIDHFFSFEKLYKSLSNFSFHDNETKYFDYFRNSLEHIAFSSFYTNIHYISPNLNSNELMALKSLSKEKDLALIKPDKLNGVIVMNRVDYVNKMMNIFNGNSKFKKVEKDV